MHNPRGEGQDWGLPGYACLETLSLADLIGVPYRQFGRDPKEGLDCTGLKIEFWRRLGVEISDPYDNHCTAEGEFVEVATKRFGDTLCVDLRGDGFEEHVAINLGIGLCIHVHRSRGVEVIPIRNLEGRVVSILRLAEDVKNN